MIGVFVQMRYAKETIEKISEDFPCFVYTNDMGDGWTEVTINCREEDACSIEDRLAKWV